MATKFIKLTIDEETRGFGMYSDDEVITNPTLRRFLEVYRNSYLSNRVEEIEEEEFFELYNGYSEALEAEENNREAERAINNPSLNYFNCQRNRRY